MRLKLQNLDKKMKYKYFTIKCCKKQVKICVFPGENRYRNVKKMVVTRRRLLIIQYFVDETHLAYKSRTIVSLISLSTTFMQKHAAFHL